MKKRYSTVLLALISFFGLGAGARAQEGGKVVPRFRMSLWPQGKLCPQAHIQ